MKGVTKIKIIQTRFRNYIIVKIKRCTRKLTIIGQLRGSVENNSYIAFNLNIDFAKNCAKSIRKLVEWEGGGRVV